MTKLLNLFYKYAIYILQTPMYFSAGICYYRYREPVVLGLPDLKSEYEMERGNMKKYRVQIMGLFGRPKPIYYETRDEAFEGLLLIKRLGGYALVQEWDPAAGCYNTILGG